MPFFLPLASNLWQTLLHRMMWGLFQVSLCCFRAFHDCSLCWCDFFFSWHAFSCSLQPWFVCFPQSKSQRCFQSHFHSDSSSLSSPPSPSLRPQFSLLSSVSSSFTDTVLCSLSDSISHFLLSFARLSCRAPSSALLLYPSPHPSASHLTAAVSDLVPLLFLSIPFCISSSSHSLFHSPLFLLSHPVAVIVGGCDYWSCTWSCSLCCSSSAFPSHFLSFCLWTTIIDLACVSASEYEFSSRAVRV